MLFAKLTLQKDQNKSHEPSKNKQKQLDKQQIYQNYTFCTILKMKKPCRTTFCY